VLFNHTALFIRFDHIEPRAFVCNASEKSLWKNEVTLTPNAIYQVLASSGSGKTTLVSILAGLRGDYSGMLHLENKTAVTYKPADWSIWRGTQASFVYQDLRLFPELSATDNIALAAVLSGEAENKTRVEQMADLLGVSHKLDTAIKWLSFGQMQRMAIIRALNRPYRWLILDEPFSHLDLKNAEAAWQLMVADARQKNAGILITSLDPYPFIQADRVFVL
jgi:putative ABC transport system ATP-binding protein